MMNKMMNKILIASYSTSRSTAFSIPLFDLSSKSRAPEVSKVTITPTKDTLISWYGLNEINWLIGFIDAEGCFFVEMTKKHTRHYLVLRLNQNHLKTLEWINSYYFNNTGSLTLDKDSNAYALRLRKVNAQWAYLIPLIDNYPLNTTKHLNYLSYKEVALIMKEGGHKNNQGKTRIEEIKKSMNSKRENNDMPLTHNKVLSPSWLIGFIEGDGSFTLEGIYPRIVISQNKRDEATLIAIKEYLPGSPGNINPLGSGLKYKDMLKYKVSQLQDIVLILNVLNQGNWHT